jgi:FixJ family two-component response regulator
MFPRPLLLLPHSMRTTRPPLIAVVDDDESVRNAICRLLRAAGFAARGFAGGCEFLESALAEPADCAVLDLHMPGMSGIEVQARLNRLWPHVATIFITGHDRPEARQQCLDAGAAAYLCKPVDGVTLITAIDAVFSKQGQSHSRAPE